MAGITETTEGSTPEGINGLAAESRLVSNNENTLFSYAGGGRILEDRPLYDAVRAN